MTRFKFVGTTMKRRILGVAVPLALTICLGASLASAEDDSQCTDATIAGSYGTLLTGTIVGLGPVAQVGVATFDGAGHRFRTEAENINGNFFPPPPQPIAGTYKVNPACTGSTLDEQGHASAFVIVNHGKEMLAMVKDRGVVFTIDLKKQ